MYQIVDLMPYSLKIWKKTFLKIMLFFRELHYKNIQLKMVTKVILKNRKESSHRIQLLDCKIQPHYNTNFTVVLKFLASCHPCKKMTINGLRLKNISLKQTNLLLSLKWFQVLIQELLWQGMENEKFSQNIRNG